MAVKQITDLDSASSVNTTDELILEQSGVTKKATVSAVVAAGGGTDSAAIHDNVSGEIAAVTEKASPVSADLLLIEDSAASNAKKRVQVGNLPGGATTLDGLSDVVITTPADNEVLAYNGVSSEFINQTAAEAGLAAASHTHTESDITDLDHTDANAIHDNVSGEIVAVTEKVTPASADVLLIEDSADSNAKKRVQVGNLPGGSGTDSAAIHDDTAGEIAAVTEKASPVSADLLLIEDSEDSNAKKRVQIGNLPGGGGGSSGEIWIPASVIYPLASGGCAPLAVTAVTSGLCYHTLDFSPTVMETAIVSTLMPADWDGGNVTISVCWMSDAGGSGNVVWQLGMAATRDNVSLSGSISTLTDMSPDAYLGDDVLMIATSGALTPDGTSLAGGDLMTIAIIRNAPDASDTYASDAKLLGIKVAYGTA